VIGEAIKRIRKSKRMTQKNLAEKTGIAEITIRQYEAGMYEPKYNNLKKIAEALGVECSDIAGNTYSGRRSEFGKKLEYFRTKVGLNKSELARKMGVTPAMVRQYENGTRNPKYETIKKFANGLSIDPECLSPFKAEYSGDVVEVVRCKDCKHRIFDGSRDLFYCEMYYGLGSVSDNNYCSFGEREEA